MVKEVFIQPQTIAAVFTEENTRTYPEKEIYFNIVIVAGITGGYGGLSDKRYIIHFNVTKEGFKVKEKTDAIIGKLLELMKNPLTCNTIVKLIPVEGTYSFYEIEFI